MQQGAGLDRAAREAGEDALAEKSAALGRASTEVADLTLEVYGLNRAAKAETSARRELQSATSALEVERRKLTDGEERCAELRCKLEESRAEVAALQAEKNAKGEALRATTDSVTEAEARAEEWRRRHAELSARVAAESDALGVERVRRASRRAARSRRALRTMMSLCLL